MKIIHIECLADETLVKSLNFPTKRVEHHLGKGNVCNAVSNKSDRAAGIALVDEDPGSAQPTTLREFSLQPNNEGMKTGTNSKGSKIIVLCPTLEGWILSQCNKSKIDVREFSFPVDYKKFHSQVNEKLDHFQRLISRLIASQNKGVQQLKSLLQA